MQELCENLDKEQVTNLLEKMVKFSPTLWNLVAVSFQADNTTESSLMETTEEPPHWCACGICRPMPKEEENVCCEIKWKNHEHPLFQNRVLTEHNLELAMQSNADFSNYPFDPANNACWRYTVYRQYTLWVWGKFRRRNRKVIPSCIVWKIRDRFPDQRENYTGFMDAEYQL